MLKRKEVFSNGKGRTDANGNGHFYKGNYTDADIDLSVAQDKLKVWNTQDIDSDALFALCDEKIAPYIMDNDINDYYLYFSIDYPKVIMLYYK